MEVCEGCILTKRMIDQISSCVPFGENDTILCATCNKNVGKDFKIPPSNSIKDEPNSNRS